MGCAAPPNLSPQFVRLTAFSLFVAAAQPNGDKSPRHKSPSAQISVRCALPAVWRGVRLLSTVARRSSPRASP
ncbi:hypothetical protein C2E19_27540 [Pseudomonas sp. DTU12.3]|nr:hypothetical protein C2E19_27540 [Pseudomonas sp. DTU12.3]